MSIAENNLTKVKVSLFKLTAKTVANNGCKYMNTATVVGFNSRMEIKFSK